MEHETTTLFVIRGQTFDKLARALADQLSDAGQDVLVVIHEPQDVCDTLPYDKVSMNEHALVSIGITGLPDNWGWFCGDFCYYMAAAAAPNYDRYCLVESDVYAPRAGIDAFINALIDPRFDAVASKLGPTTKRKIYSRDLVRLGLNPAWGCIFPVTAISSAVLSQMKSLRSEVLKDYPKTRLNDEAILAGTVQRGAFHYAALEQLLPGQIGKDCFDTNPPHLYEGIVSNGTERRIFHPVVTFDTVLHRITTGEKNYSKHRLRKVLKAAPPTLKKTIIAHLAQCEKPQTPLREGPEQMNDLFAALNIGSRLRVLDVGANPLIEGEVSYQKLLDQGRAEVIGFEPQLDALEALNNRKTENELYLPSALGDGKDHMFHSYKQPGFNSVFEADPASAALLGFHREMRQVGTNPISTDKLDDLKIVPKVDFLKIDVQGSEKSILEHGRSKLSEVIVVQTEVRMFPLYKDEPRYGELEAELVQQGFEFLRFASLKHVCLAGRFGKRLNRNQFAQAVDGDAFFVRDLRNIERFNDEQLKKLVVIADAIMQSYDLALFALDILANREAVTTDLVDWYFSQLPKSARRD